MVNEAYEIKLLQQNFGNEKSFTIIKCTAKIDMLLQPKIKYVKYPMLDLSNMILIGPAEYGKFYKCIELGIKTCKEIKKEVEKL